VVDFLTDRLINFYKAKKQVEKWMKLIGLKAMQSASITLANPEKFPNAKQELRNLVQTHLYRLYADHKFDDIDQILIPPNPESFEKVVDYLTKHLIDYLREGKPLVDIAKNLIGSKTASLAAIILAYPDIYPPNTATPQVRKVIYEHLSKLYADEDDDDDNNNNDNNNDDNDDNDDNNDDPKDDSDKARDDEDQTRAKDQMKDKVADNPLEAGPSSVNISMQGRGTTIMRRYLRAYQD